MSDSKYHTIVVMHMAPHAQYLQQTLGTKAFSTDPTTDTTAQGFNAHMESQVHHKVIRRHRATGQYPLRFHSERFNSLRLNHF